MVSRVYSLLCRRAKMCVASESLIECSVYINLRNANKIFSNILLKFIYV